MHFMSIGHAYENAARLVGAVLDRYPSSASLHRNYREAVTALRPMPVKGSGIATSYEDGAWAKHRREYGIFGNIRSIQISTAW